MRSAKSVPYDYEEIFADASRKISHRYSYIFYNTNISPIGRFFYDSKYSVVITKLKVNKTFDPSVSIYLEYGNPELTQNKVYAGFETANYQINILPDSNSASSIYLTVDGCLIDISKASRSLLCYNFSQKGLSLSYNNLKRNDFNVKVSNSPQITSLIFFKHLGFLYILLITKSNANSSTPIFNLKNIIGTE